MQHVDYAASVFTSQAITRDSPVSVCKESHSRRHALIRSFALYHPAAVLIRNVATTGQADAAVTAVVNVIAAAEITESCAAAATTASAAVICASTADAVTCANMAHAGRIACTTADSRVTGILVRFT